MAVVPFASRIIRTHRSQLAGSAAIAHGAVAHGGVRLPVDGQTAAGGDLYAAVEGEVTAVCQDQVDIASDGDARIDAHSFGRCHIPAVVSIISSCVVVLGHLGVGGTRIRATI